MGTQDLGTRKSSEAGNPVKAKNHINFKAVKIILIFLYLNVIIYIINFLFLSIA